MLGGLTVVSPKWPTEQRMLLSRMNGKVFFFKNEIPIVFSSHEITRSVYGV